MSENKTEDLLREAVRTLELWLHPKWIRCRGSAHNGKDVVSCTCRQVKLRTKTVEFLAEKIRPFLGKATR